jgi:hypothetical protein
MLVSTLKAKTLSDFKLCFQFQLAPYDMDDYVIWRKEDFTGTLGTYDLLSGRAKYKKGKADHLWREAAERGAFQPSTASMTEDWGPKRGPVVYTVEVETLREAFVLAKKKFGGAWPKVVDAINALMPIDFGSGEAIGITVASQFAAGKYKIKMRARSHEHWLKYIRAWVDGQEKEAAATTTGNSAPASASSAPVATTGGGGEVAGGGRGEAAGGNGEAAGGNGEAADGGGCFECTSATMCAACAMCFV